MASANPVNLTRYAWLSVAAALATIGLKTSAWWWSGSVGLLSDAAESVVNLVAAVTALVALRIAASPPDAGHHYGHGKAEYFSAFFEGLLIFGAAAWIAWSAVDRLLHPQPLHDVGIGLAISVVAGVLNGAVAWILVRAGRQHRSATLTADGKHLWTDVATSVGVVAGVGVVWLTGIGWLDPVVALLVAANILWTGWKLVRESATALLDESMPWEDHRRLVDLLGTFVREDVSLHALRTRVSGRQRFAEVHVLVPGSWSVQSGHDLCESISDAAAAEFDDLVLLCHLEPLEDPRSWDDIPVASLVVDIPRRERPAGPPPTVPE